ncbi:Cdc7p-Dbf4p kinase complex regulatory subunit [Massospora cicadina]|nr:Cdc7p-Dbf4p kinase complex regulatory subunit [Massospora cicadina]
MKRVEDTYTDRVTHILFLPPPLEPNPAQNLPNLMPIKEEQLTPKLYSQAPARLVSPYHTPLPMLPNPGGNTLRGPPRKFEPQEPHFNTYRGLTNDYMHREEPGKAWYYESYHREASKLKAMVVPSRSHQGAPSFPKPTNFAPSGYPKVQHRRSEIHFFRYPYILSEDVSGVYRPAVAAEYPPAKDPDDVLWPKLWPVSPSRCPFIRMVPHHKAGTLPEKRAGENLPGFRSKLAKHSQSRHRAYPGPGNLGGVASRELEQRKRSALMDRSASKVGADRLAALPNGFLYLERRGATRKSLPPPIRPIRTKSSAPAAIANTKKPGYCENCRTKFSDIEEHVVSQAHRTFALKESNFQSLDGLLRTLKRNLKPNPFLAPTPTVTNPSSSSPHHWYGKSARDYESEATSNPNQTYSFDLAGGDTRTLFVQPLPLSDQPPLDNLGGAVLDQS